MTMWNIYHADMEKHRRERKKLGNKIELPRPVETTKKAPPLSKVRDFFGGLGKELESIIDSSFLGVPDPEPWSPLTDKKAAALSKPVQTTVEFMNKIRHSVENVLAMPTPFATIFFAGEVGVLAVQNVLLGVRDNLTNVLKDDEQDRDLALAADSDADGFVKLGTTADEKHPAKAAVKNFAMNTVLPFLDNIAVQMSREAIIVTPDDCDVASECEQCPLLDDEDFQDCPSVVTDCADPDDLEFISEDDVLTEAAEQARSCQNDSIEDDYIIAEEPQSDDDSDDFVDVRAEFDITYCP